MRLKEYLKKHNINLKDFANKIKYGPAYLYSISAGSIKPGAKLAKSIVEATGGEVTLEDLKDTVEGYSRATLCPCCKQFHS